MAKMLLIEAILVCLIAFPVGWWVRRARASGHAAGWRDPILFALTIILAVAILGLGIWFFAARDILPLQHLPAATLRYDLDCLGGVLLVSEILLALVVPVAALAYLIGGLPSMTFAVATLALLEAAALCLAAIARKIPLTGLDVLVFGLGVWAVGFAGACGIAWRGRARTRAPLIVGWTGFFLLCLLIAFTIGRSGVLFILLPAVLVFLATLYVLGAAALPVESPAERWNAFRSLLTFALGTNYPFYVIEDWHTRERRDDALPAPRVPGNPFSRFFSGPGIVLNDANHTAVLWDSINYRIAHPGLNFTQTFEQLFAAVDLRPQLRNATIKAETADGIATSTFVFMPQKIAAGSQSLQLGASYPYDEEALLQAVCDNAYVEHHFSRNTENLADEQLQRIRWDALSQMLAPPILRDLILARKCDDLHQSGTARREIADEFVRRLREQLAQVGIELVGGGLSNINVPQEVAKQRIANWQAKWKRQIEIELGKEDAEVAAQLDPIWARAQLEVYSDLAQILKQAGDLDLDTIALQLVDALGAMPPKQKNVQDIPTFMWAMMRHGRSQEGER